MVFLCVAYLFIKRTKTFLKLEYVLLFLFCCSYAITILVSGTEHLINEVAILGYTGMLFFAMNYCDIDRDERIKRIINIVMDCGNYHICIFTCWIFDVSIFCFSRNKPWRDYFCIWYERKQTWGLYNPNSGSVLNYVSILLTVLLPKKKLGVKIFLGMNIVIQVYALF